MENQPKLVPLDELRFHKFEFEIQHERQKIGLQYLNNLTVPVIFASLFYSMTFAASLILILVAIYSFCNFREERFAQLMFQKQMIILAFDIQNNNPELAEQIRKMDQDEMWMQAERMAHKFEEFQEQQQQQSNQGKLKEISKGKPTKVSFKKNSKANKISRSEKRIRTIVMNDSRLP